MKISIPPVLKEIASILKEADYSCYLVGGAIRNALTGLPVYDYDLATDALPEEVVRLFRRVIPTGIKHGTVTILYKGESFETTTFRVDGTYSNSRHPDQISYTPSLSEDLKRRDFTINSIAADVVSGELIDPNDGIGDIKRKIIKAIGNPLDRFNEDGLRALRACRFSAQLEFTLDLETEEGISKSLESFKKVSAERIFDEIRKTMNAPQPSRAFFIMERTGMLEIILPELTACKGIEQKGRHHFDVFTHSLISCDGALPGNLIVRMAALLHDIGKPVTKNISKQGEVTFYNHEKVSAKMARKILKRFKCSNEIIDGVSHLIENHMFHYEPNWTDAAVRRFIVRAGKQNLEKLYLLRKADHYGAEGKHIDSPELKELVSRVEEVLKNSNSFSIKDLAVDGYALSNEAQIPTGPIMGKILNLLLEAVLDDQTINTKEQLLFMATKIYKKNFR